MGSKKLLKKLAGFFDLDSSLNEKKKEEMGELLVRLKQKEVELKEKLELETNEGERKKLQQTIDLVHSQRKKGLGVLQELRDQGREQ